ncbi:hypothetical protein B0H66DRAFT_276536 [Apodospora peruviana]|uniref:Uncharacterized protein n=1 Tax=Apodospora peruviana TaxID=516989 RepID=A0AAE0M1Z5_9PEZI|nr:hypothetical protein B0H66DRAFT_276536 [Apodospora peruviana]
MKFMFDHSVIRPCLQVCVVSAAVGFGTECTEIMNFPSDCETCSVRVSSSHNYRQPPFITTHHHLSSTGDRWLGACCAGLFEYCFSILTVLDLISEV